MNFNLFLSLHFFLLSFFISQMTTANEGSMNFYTKGIIVNFEQTDIKEAFKILAQKSDLKIKISETINGTVNASYGKITPAIAAKQIANDFGLKFFIKDETLIVDNKNVLQGTTEGENKTTASSDLQENSMTFIQLKYLDAKGIPERLKDFLKSNEKILVDEASNSIAILGTEKSVFEIKSYLKFIDIPPQQISIEAQIVELTKNKSRELGVSFGDLTNPTAELKDKRTFSGVSKSYFSGTPNAMLGIQIGSMAGNPLQARLDAFEVSGEAKVLSRPKVTTLNNITASINSGISFYVKTLSSEAQSGGGITAGGVKEIKAGLTLEVTPAKVGHSDIRLKVSVRNSEPDTANSVDGIPGVNENSANATIIVPSGDTAVMAGLVKNNSGQSQNGLPGLSNIPLIGWLFKSELQRSRDSELMIFITPRILEKEDSKLSSNEKKEIPETKGFYQ